VNDNWMTDRVKGLRQAHTVEPTAAPLPEAVGDEGSRHQALQVLFLAQRTADDHVASARQQADKIHADAQANAEQIIRDAQARAYTVREETEAALSEARAKAEQIATDAEARSEQARRDADAIVSEARARAEQIAADARARADELQRRAQQRYEDVVGSLAEKREALQQDIQGLEQFDREYRTQLINFMQAQLRTLWVDARRVTEIEHSGATAPASRQPALSTRSAAPAGPKPALEASSAAVTQVLPVQQSGAVATTDAGAAQKSGATSESLPAQRKPSE
jgi:vacuolar-type H+-ATPase subunit H